jgi:hypothetical protein
VTNQENTLYVLNELSNTESADLEYAEIDVFYESDEGAEGAAQYDMPTIANMAIVVINTQSKRIAELKNQVKFEMGQKAMAREQRQRVISRLNSYLIKRANEIGECLPMYLVDHIKEFKGGAE